MSKREASTNSCGLYIISPPHFKLLTFSDLLKSAIEGLNEVPGVGQHAAFQLRLKQGDDDDILRAAERMKRICADAGVVFLLNDRADLVAKTEAVGVSCYDSRHLAMEAAEEGADYVSFGAFYPSVTKKDPKGKPSKEILEWWSTYTTIPCVAIGGITPENCGELVRAGADFIAAISSIWTAPDSPREAVKDFLNEMERAKSRTLKH